MSNDEVDAVLLRLVTGLSGLLAIGALASGQALVAGAAGLIAVLGILTLLAGREPEMPEIEPSTRYWRKPGE